MPHVRQHARYRFAPPKIDTSPCKLNGKRVVDDRECTRTADMVDATTEDTFEASLTRKPLTYRCDLIDVLVQCVVDMDALCVFVSFVAAPHVHRSL